MYTTDAIVLSKVPAGEMDELVTLYTEQYGKMRGVAQGIKKEEAKLRGHLELLSRSTVGVVPGKYGERLVYAEMEDFFPAIRSSIARLRAGHYAVRMIDLNCFPGERDPQLWHLLLTTLHMLNDQNFPADELRPFLREFERQFLARLGYEGVTDARKLGSLVARPEAGEYT